MNFDPRQLSQLLNNIQYPVDKDEVVRMAQQQGMNDQITGMLQKMLPEKTFNSPQELQSSLSSIAGNLGNTGPGNFKF